MKVRWTSFAKTGYPTAPPERRYLTIMFIDLVGYTELSEQLEPDDLLALSNRYHQLAVVIMERFGGFVAHFLGDEILVYFGYPTAHGNDAERALRAALEMIERLSAMDFPLSDGGTRRLAARIGVHTGLVIVGAGMMSSGHNAHGIVGEAPNLAARLQSEAPTERGCGQPGHQRSCRGSVRLRAARRAALKGLSQPVEISQVIERGPRPSTNAPAGSQARPPWLGATRRCRECLNAGGWFVSSRGAKF